MPIIDHFGWIAPFYERLIGGSQAPDWPELLELFGGLWVLDAGGGTGRVAQHLHYQGCRVIVADESLPMLRQAQVKEGLRTTCSRTEALPFPAESFDRVILVDALHHVVNQEITVRELFRVLKAGGILVVKEPDINNFFIKVIALMERLLLMRSHFLAPEEIAALFRDYPAAIEMIRRDGNAWITIRREK